MKRFAVIAATACALALPVHAQTVATVNGQAITQDKIDSFVDLLVSQGAQDSEELRSQVRQEMINRVIAVQAAEKAGIPDKKDVRQEIELATQGILVRALMTDYLEKNPVTDADIQTEYNKLKQAQGDQLEYKVRHILVNEEQQAKDLIAAIKAGKTTFEDAAKKESVDAGSGKQGGDLGWGPASNYVPEFAQAVEQLKKGRMSEEPVQSQFGWHIIDVEDNRALSFPDLDDVKPQLEELLRQQKLAQFQQDLLSNATIQ